MASRRTRTRRIAALLALPLLLAANDAPAPSGPAGQTTGQSATLTVSFTGLRSAKGYVRACLTRDPRFFPNCEKDPHALKQSVAATPPARISFSAVASGDYALSVLHDENGNARADMLLGIPREGFGFSENPRIRFGPPKFAAARFHIGTGDLTKEVRLQYFL
ncbi:DUF2141 domain-containing protein [Sphingobium sufflavum]|uniref:DUF2141 domain-containing protein n=1 Tax=Sphingobium sufflavum TaxID=1129547 RepID=UPI001F1B4661|nr:DUF2141 domain-containing protein [Sphingobium sufflavum]MCE7796054.1 DUF2141 domain-containing protein [Sphingobium sufflavum]